MKRFCGRIISTSLVLVMLAGCITGVNGKAAQVKKSDAVKSLKVTNVSKKKLSLKTGQKFTLKTKVTLKKGKKASKKVKYTSDKKSIATVSSKGVIKAKKAGKAKITVAAKANAKKKVIIKVTVTKEVKVSKISLDKTSLTLCTEDAWTVDSDMDWEYKLKATVSPSKAGNKSLTWDSSDDTVAEIEEDGTVTAVGEGTAVITVKATDGSGAKATCRVTVLDDYYEDDPDEDLDDDYDDYYNEEDEDY